MSQWLTSVLKILESFDGRPRKYRVPRAGTIYYVLSKDPPIISIPYGLHYPFLNLISKERKTYFLFWLWSSTESANVLAQLKNEHVEFGRRYPQKEYIFLCNSSRQYDLFGTYDLPRMFCNHNAFLDDRMFKINAGAVKTFDAIYTAKLEPFKRHQLASNVKSLALAAHPFGYDKRYGKYIKATLTGATWLTKNFEKDRFMIRPEDMYKYINQARVGLCLSAEEGAMYASAEYLLCGLPVVSTRSTGGRDTYFDDTYVKIVEDTPEAVAEGVEEMIERNIDPHYIRERTITKMKEHRDTFINLIQSIYDKECVKRDFREEWPRIVINKLLARRHEVEI
jgi:glycosyltransferase involved in cell wall biosynthesis